MPKKPSNLIYGVDDAPPLTVTLILGLQHVLILFIALIFPVLIVRQLGDSITPEIGQSFVSLSMLAGGITTILQALKKGPVGSGYLCPAVCGPSYMDASRMAAATGGFPLLFGMTAVVGVIEALFSRVMHKLRFLFPPEVTGVVVSMVGIVVIPLAVQNFFGIGGGDAGAGPAGITIGFVTFATMVALNVWSRGKLKLYCTLIGMAVGYLASYLLGLIPGSDIRGVFSAPLLAGPCLSHISWKFDFTLLIPFTVAALCSTLKTVGDLATCQKINDADWNRLEMKTVGGGILADGLGGVIPGVIGGFGQSTSSANIGLSIATGATSRKIAFAVGGIFISLSFSPKLAQIFLIMPKPVMGATLIFAVSFMIVAGFQIIMSRMMDARKTFVVGASIIFGLSVNMVPGLYNNIHSWIRPAFSSSLSLATISAVLLNLILRIGIAKRKTLELRVGVDSSEKIFDFMENQGRTWGARPEVIYQAIAAMNEFIEAAGGMELEDERILMDAKFDELNLDIFIFYRGRPLQLPAQRPSREELRSDDTAARKLSGYMIQQYADRVTASEKGGRSILHLHFDH